MFMFNHVLPLAVAAASFFANVHAQNFTLDTPSNVLQCRPTLVTWTGATTPPLYLSINPGNLTNTTLLDLGVVTGSSYTWMVNYRAGTTLALTLRDGTGASKQTAVFPVLTSTDSSCLNGTSTNGSTTTSLLSTTTTPVSARPPTTNIGTGTSTSVTPASPSHSGSSSTSSANKIIANSVIVSIGAAVFAILA